MGVTYQCSNTTAISRHSIADLLAGRSLWTKMTLMMMLMMMSCMRQLLLVVVRGRHLCRICVDGGRGQLASRMMRRAVGPYPTRLTTPRGC